MILKKYIYLIVFRGPCFLKKEMFQVCQIDDKWCWRHELIIFSVSGLDYFICLRKRCDSNQDERKNDQKRGIRSSCSHQHRLTFWTRIIMLTNVCKRERAAGNLFAAAKDSQHHRSHTATSPGRVLDTFSKPSEPGREKRCIRRLGSWAFRVRKHLGRKLVASLKSNLDGRSEIARKRNARTIHNNGFHTKASLTIGIREGLRVDVGGGAECSGDCIRTSSGGWFLKFGSRTCQWWARSIPSTAQQARRESKYKFGGIRAVCCVVDWT